MKQFATWPVSGTPVSPSLVSEISGVGDDRYLGWETAMEGLRLPTRGLVARAADGIASGQTSRRPVARRPRPPSALVCVSDAMALRSRCAL